MAETQIFIVRVWQQLSQFHAPVRRVDEEAPQLFTEPAQLTEFLVHRVAVPADPSGLVKPGEST